MSINTSALFTFIIMIFSISNVSDRNLSLKWEMRYWKQCQSCDLRLFYNLFFQASTRILQVWLNPFYFQNLGFDALVFCSFLEAKFILNRKITIPNLILEFNKHHNCFRYIFFCFVSVRYLFILLQGLLLAYKYHWFPNFR